MLEEIYKETEEKMAKSCELLKKEFIKLRTGRASPGIVENIQVNAYNSILPLSQVASCMVPEPRLLMIKPWDRSLLPEIEKAILRSDLGLTPMNDGTVIRLNIPSLTEERRKNLVKLARRMAEESKIAIRNVRRSAKEEIKKDEKISEDDEKRADEKIQKLTDKYIEKIDKICGNKEKEIMEI
jgi:ribosome recycling factor